MIAKYEYHEFANLFPMMTASEAEALQKDMGENGFRAEYPVILHEGKILDGRNRYEAALVTDTQPVFVEFGGSDALGFVVASNLNRRHLSESQRMMVAGRLANMQLGDNQHTSGSANLPTLPSSPLVSQSQAASLLNVSERSVRTAKQVLTHATPEVIALVDSGELAASRAAVISKATPEVQQAAVEEIKAGKPHVAQNSGNNEWYTPEPFILAAREVLGQIDLDPASSEIANKTVGAAQYYTQMDNGLVKKWTGKVWLNPPYAANLIKAFCSKLVAHFREGEVSEAVVLVNNGTETEWFDTLSSVAAAVVFPRSRVKFLDPDGLPGAPLQGQAVLYFGGKGKQFVEAFRIFGDGWVPYGR